MTQDTRKDPRAKVLTMTVRYKSATVDEFIEQYSLDISRGGIFIKTSSPFKAGTLLKFEIRIAEDRTVLQGVGRVVWKREPTDADQLRPAGMGVKFIKIDESSKQVIEELVQRHTESGATYETGLQESEAAAVAAADGQSPEVAPAAPARKATMIGLGGMDAAAVIAAAQAQASSPSEADSKDSSEAEEPASSTFFPETDSIGDMPPLGEQTVMRQAAELLQEALLGAGGTMDEIGSIGAQPLVDETGQGAGLELSKAVSPSVFPPARSSASSQSLQAVPVDIPSMDGLRDSSPDSNEADAEAEAAEANEAPAEVAATAARRPPSERPPASTEQAKSPAPPPVAASVPATVAASSSKSGGGRAFIYLGLVAAAAAALYFAFGASSQEDTAEPKAPAVSAPETAPKPAEAPAESVEEKVEETKVAAEPAEPTPTPDEQPAPKEVRKEPSIKPAVAPVEKPKPAAAAPVKPAAEKPAPKAAPEKPAKPAVDAEKPPAPAAEKPKPAPKPAPPPADDNPY